ncbi:PREDICTED: cell cycle checkpoint control protein RAD9A [Calidris pugnax]|uniref:cell cycle checkpoint control protein RAD9A n=1 Tax=Calidris pugnax TaxID=198806 RepID=UPI00071C1F5A|nr:PREDICTED: cell cycle checkpoint control protein RAD9A [Calidris pugnax]
MKDGAGPSERPGDPGGSFWGLERTPRAGRRPQSPADSLKTASHEGGGPARARAPPPGGGATASLASREERTAVRPIGRRRGRDEGRLPPNGEAGAGRAWEGGRRCQLPPTLYVLSPPKLSLRAVNSSRSAFASFLFAPLFFQRYEAGGSPPDSQLFRCKVLMKSFLGVFRSLPSLEKTVEKCLILLKPRASRLVVQLHCKYGVTKTHNLAFQECERLQAVFDTQRCASSLRAPARVLAEAVVHFPQTLAEVTLGAGPRGKISLQNYVEDETERSKMMVTELCLAEDEFQTVAVAPGSRITFCLKEFRGLLSFAEASNLPLTIHYDAPGR